jgi:exosortase
VRLSEHPPCKAGISIAVHRLRLLSFLKWFFVTIAVESTILPSAVSSVQRDTAVKWTPARFSTLAALLLAGFFATRGAWDDIAHIASRDEEASHIWAVPFLAIWLAWIRRDVLFTALPRSDWLGPCLVAVGWAMSHWGFYGAKQSPWHLGALLVVLGCALSAAGSGVLLAIWPAVVVLLFIIPVPGMVRQQLSIPLERTTAAITSGALHLLGVPIERSGNVIIVNRIPVTVAEACNGLRMIFPLFLIVYVFCFMLPLQAWVRWVLLLTSPLSAVLCNVLRLLPTVLLYGYGSKHNADQFHNYSGWPMVVIAFFALMGLIKIIEWLGIPLMKPRAAI